MPNKKHHQVTVLFVVSWVMLAIFAALLLKSQVDNQRLKGLLLLSDKKSVSLDSELRQVYSSRDNHSVVLDYLEWQFVLKEQVNDAGNRLRSRINKISDLKKDKELSGLLYYNLGLNYVLAADFNSAIRSFEQAIGLQPKDAESYYMLGLLYSTYRQDTKKAVRYYEKYLQLAGTKSPRAREVEERIEAMQK